ncbi:MAG TPA: chitobiase/beta-hexosaminidase C-terminal domain-containing protein, partial [Verrucomicrobiae bacterium]|nr:chitobiase/beta-hexosaminidase C-terminal domain-containing protein [Verrucomicrobiae bacterium]
NQLGTVTVEAEHWYKFVVGVTNTSGASGNMTAGCALYDYGSNGLIPGPNLITFSTATSHAALAIATEAAVWPALRAFEDGGVSAWDNFLVYTSNSPPVITLSLSNAVVATNSTATFYTLADGPGPITYAWYTNNVLAPGATRTSYTTLPVEAGLTNVTVVAMNEFGSTTNSATISQPGPSEISFFGDGTNWTINEVGIPSASISGNVLNGTDGGGNEWVTAWYNSEVNINGFTATFTYQNVGGVPGDDADGASFDLQESGTNYLNNIGNSSGGSLGIFDMSPSADWEINIYNGNGIGILYNTDGVTGGYLPTGSVNVANGDPINFTIVYTPGGLVQETLVDTATQATFVTNYNVGDLTSLLGSSFAYVGLTISSGGVGGAQNISDFTYQAVTNAFTLAVLTNLPASSVDPTSATLNGEVITNGGYTPTVTLYYGATDGGTNAGNWANSVTLGLETAAFNLPITGLAPNTTYYYAAKAVNYAGTSWASPSQSFLTGSVSPPTVANAPATGIGATLATLNGQVVSTGGVPTTVTLYYGPADGGTNAGGWASNISIGLQSGVYAQTIGSLSSNTTYFFTAGASNSSGVAWATPSLNFTTLATNPVSTLTAVLTYHNDNTRMGLNSTETILTPANVNTNSFGKLFSCAVDGFVYAQPLIMTNVSIPGKGTHNVVYVATEHDSVFAFDADNNSGANASPLWQTSFLGPGVTTMPSGDSGSSDITPEIGITATPVIDPVSGTIYCEVKTLEGGSTFVHRLHALDITTGLERTNFDGPVVIQCTNYPGVGNGDNDGENPPHVLWNAEKEHDRPALTLLNGVVYLAYASHGDATPYHGWFFGYNATNLSLAPSVYNSTPNGGNGTFSGGGFWDGGGGPSVDAQGNMYFQTGNGNFDQVATITSSNNYAMSVIKFATSNGLQMVDFFAPSDAVSLSGGDEDLGSAAPIILPDSAGSAAHPHLVVGGGKTSPIYLMDRDNMGRWNSTTDQIVQEFNGSYPGDRDTTPAFFNNTLYVFDSSGKIGAYSITNASFNTTPVETPDGYDNKGGATACISANGTSNAIVWAIYNSGGETPTTPCILRAYNATNLTQELYTSDQIASRDSAGDAVKFIAPAIANGKVYVAAQYSLTVYGLATTFVATPVISPDGGVFTNSVLITLTDPTAGASIYYTLDGTAPTTNSFLYSGPFNLTVSASVTAGAFKPGAVASGTVSASFINSSAVGNGSGLLGNYWANTTSAAFVTPGFNTPPTLTRVDPTIDFDWNTSQPATNVGPDTYVVQWTGTVEPQFNETYTFSTTTDDGVMLYVNGQLLVNEWVPQAPTTWSGSIALVAQQRYNITMDYFQAGGGAEAYLFWSSPSEGPMTIIPESQLYPVTNPPPSVALTGPSNGATYTASASVSLIAEAATQFNPLSYVSFYVGSTLLGSVSNAPYSLTTTGLGVGGYALTAVAVDGSGLAATSAVVDITVTAPTGQPYGLTNYPTAPPFYNMPPVFTGALPTNLSQTGIFSDTPSMTPVASLIPYAPNVQLFSDNAQKVRYFSIPSSGAPYTPDQQIAYAPTFSWSFPAGTVFVKTFELQTNDSDPTNLLRLETRLLVRDTNGAVYGVTYKWRPDYSDADLLTNSLFEPVLIQTADGFYTNLWYYPSPTDCLQCHTAPANYVLGVNARQLNGNFNYPNGVTDNQLRALNRTGLLYPAINEADITNVEQLSSLTNTAASYEQRARSYLDANCAQCHIQPGGSGPTFDARYDIPLTNQMIINVPAVKGNFGYDNVNIVTPDDIWRSSIYYRMNEADLLTPPSTQMPPLARYLIDTNAVQVMADWINSLPGTPALPPPTIDPAGGSFEASVNVTIEPATTNETLYYTLDGSLPTTNSLLYTGPFQLTNSATVTANAWELGFIDSVVGAAQFIVVPGAEFISPTGFSNGVF